MRTWSTMSLSIGLSLSAVLLWPNLIFFSKTVFLPDWVSYFPNPWVASWSVFLIAFIPALVGPHQLKLALGRLTLCAVGGGPAIGVFTQFVLWGWGNASLTNLVAQLLWVIIVRALPPALMVLAAATIRAGLAKKVANHSFKADASGAA